MSRGAWELASGAKESGVSALFKGASLISRKGERVSAVTGLQDKTALFYFASKRVESGRSVNELLSKFYDVVREKDDSIVVIFVSNDSSKEDQVEMFNESGMHTEWLMVEYTPDLEEIAESFKVEKIPCLVVVNRDGRAVVPDALDQVWAMVAEEGKKGAAADMERFKAAVDAKWAEWRRLAGDWRASAGHTLGGSASSSSAGPAAAAAAPGGGAAPAAGARNDREALRAARLAALEKRMGGGGGGAAGADPSASSSGAGAAASSASAAASAAAPPVAAAPVAFSSGPRIATLGGSGAGGSFGAGGSSAAAAGSGTFAGGAAAAGLGSVAYTLAGGRVELPPPDPMPGLKAGGRPTDDDEVFSDMASDGAGSGGDHMDLPDAPTEEQAVQSIVDMGFPADAALRALQASNGDVDSAVALLLGE